MRARRAELCLQLARVRRGRRVGALIDAFSLTRASPRDLVALADGRAHRQRRRRRSSSSRRPTSRGPATAPATVMWLGAEQSNSSLIVDDAVMLKIFRRIAPASIPRSRWAASSPRPPTSPTRRRCWARSSASGRRQRRRAGRRPCLRAQPGRCLDLGVEPFDRDLRRLRRRREAGRRSQRRRHSRLPARPRRRRSAGSSARCTARWRSRPTIRAFAPRAGHAPRTSRRWIERAMRRGAGVRRHRQRARPGQRSGRSRRRALAGDARGARRALARARASAGEGMHDAHPRRLPSRPGAGRQATSTSSTSRASRSARSPSGARKTRRCATSPACCARSTMRPAQRSTAARRARRERRSACASGARLARRGRGAVPRGYREVAGTAGYRDDEAGDEPARPVPDREGALRDRLRGGQPAGLAGDPGARRARTSTGRRCASAGMNRTATPQPTLGDPTRPTSRRSSPAGIGDPFGVLGPHDGAGRRASVRVFVPGAEAVEVLDAGRRAPLAELERVARRRASSPALVDGRRRRFALSPALPRRGAGTGTPTIPIASGRCSASSTSICSTRAAIASSTSGSAPIRSTHRRRRRRRASRCGRPTRGASASSATSTPGTAAATRCACASRRASGSSSCPASAPGALYKFEILGAGRRAACR